MFASLNHTTELIINEHDVTQAIQTVQQLSKDFKLFKDYDPRTDDGYYLLYNFFLEHPNEVFQKTKLVARHKDFGFKRDVFRREFDEILDVVAKMAEAEGNYLIRRPINNNSGLEVYLYVP